MCCNLRDVVELSPQLYFTSIQARNLRAVGLTVTEMSNNVRAIIVRLCLLIRVSILLTTNKRRWCCDNNVSNRCSRN